MDKVAKAHDITIKNYSGMVAYYLIGAGYMEIQELNSAEQPQVLLPAIEKYLETEDNYMFGLAKEAFLEWQYATKHLN